LKTMAARSYSPTAASVRIGSSIVWGNTNINGAGEDAHVADPAIRPFRDPHGDVDAQLPRERRHAVRAEPEPVLDLQGQIHPCQAVQSKVVQGGGWLSLLVVQRPAEMVLQQPLDRRDRDWLDRAQRNILSRRRAGERKPAWAQQVMVGNERGRLDE
jgi:hypothetical protein